MKIGKFSYGWPDIQELRRIIPKQCELKGECNNGLLSARHVLIRASCLEDCKLVVEAGLLLTTQGMDIYNENFEVGSNVLSRGRTSTAIAGISFPSLPPNFFVKEAVFSLATAVGKPLQVDLATKNQTRPSCAKVKVEVDLLREFPKRINVGMRKKSGEGHQKEGNGETKEGDQTLKSLKAVEQIKNTKHEEVQELNNKNGGGWRVQGRAGRRGETQQESQDKGEEDNTKKWVVEAFKDTTNTSRGSETKYKVKQNVMESSNSRETIISAIQLGSTQKNKRLEVVNQNEEEGDARSSNNETHMNAIVEHIKGAENEGESGPIKSILDLEAITEEEKQRRREREEDIEVEENIERMAREGDLSPRHRRVMESSAKRGKQNQPSLPLQVKTRATRIDDWKGEVFRDSGQHLTVKISESNVEILITAVYARCEALERLELWEELEQLVEDNTLTVKEIQLEISPTSENREEQKLAEAELKIFLYVEEEFWKQKADIRWFQDGDRNTRFFHNYVKGRRKKLRLTEIQTIEGDTINTSENIGAEAVAFFEKQFKEDQTSGDEWMLDVIPKLITKEQNEEITRLSGMKEVKKVVFELNGASRVG
ncbi:hypothetical protein KY285_036369 [Solanum tuberosum]|nr:hypothetical protein KY285_036369 [Solanum tuberosum]